MVSRAKTADALTIEPDNDQQGEFQVIQHGEQELQEFDEAERADLEFQAFLKDINAIGDSGRVKVYKLENGLFKSQIYLFDCAPSEFSENLLGDPEYHSDGFHDFRVVGRDRTGIVTAKTLKIFPRKDFKKPGLIETPSQDMGAIIAPIMAVIAAASENTNKILAAMAEQNKAVPQKSTLETLQELAQMKQLFGSESTKADPMELVRNSLELAKLMNPPEGGASGMDALMKALDTFGKPIAEAVAHMGGGAAVMQPAPQTPPQAPRIGAPQAAPIVVPKKPATISDQPASETEDESIMMLKITMKMAVHAAKSNGDPALYADIVYDKFGDELAQYMDAPNWFEMLCTIEPTVALHRPWFEELRSEIKNILTEESNAGTVEKTNPGIIVDVSSATANTNNGDFTGNS